MSTTSNRRLVIFTSHSQSFYRTTHSKGKKKKGQTHTHTLCLTQEEEEERRREKKKDKKGREKLRYVSRNALM